MKPLILIIVLVSAATGCGTLHLQPPDENAALASALLSPSGIRANIERIVQEIRLDAVIGERTEDRITARLSHEYLNRHVDNVADTNLVVNVNCGDPIYDVTMQIRSSVITNLKVTITPVCPE
jgi:predicted nucleic acid-binding protein